VHVSSLEEAKVTARSISHDADFNVPRHLAESKLSARMARKKAARQGKPTKSGQNNAKNTEDVHPSAKAGSAQARQIMDTVDRTIETKKAFREFIHKYNDSMSEVQTKMKERQLEKEKIAQKNLKKSEKKLDGIQSFFADAYGYKNIGSSVSQYDTDKIYTNEHRTLREALGRCNEMRDAHKRKGQSKKLHGCKGVVSTWPHTKYQLVKQLNNDKSPLVVPVSHFSEEQQTNIPKQKFWAADDTIRTHGAPLLSAIQNLDKRIDQHRSKKAKSGFVNKMLDNTPAGHARALLKAGGNFGSMLRM